VNTDQRGIFSHPPCAGGEHQKAGGNAFCLPQDQHGSLKATESVRYLKRLPDVSPWAVENKSDYSRFG
jgi:hypothetical protein